VTDAPRGAERRSAIRRHLQVDLALDLDAVDDETPLFSSGLVDSLSMLGFVSFLEGLVGRPIRPTDMTLENLDSVRRILGLLEGYDREG
jgi:acyl carrier protein